MPQATIRSSGQWETPCVGCGRKPHERLDLVTEKGQSAWQGCKTCWALAMARGHIELVRSLCRIVDASSGARPPEEVLR